MRNKGSQKNIYTLSYKAMKRERRQKNIQAKNFKAMKIDNIVVFLEYNLNKQ